MQWKLNKEDQNIVFLIKTMKKEFLEDTLNKGNLCFNLPELFNSSSTLMSGQFDRWDSHLFYDVCNIYYAPIISEDENGIHYGKGVKLAKEAHAHERSFITACTPLCSFRKVEESDCQSVNGALLFQLGNIVDRIKNEFGHDVFILVHQPLELLRRIGNVTSYYARSIHYGEIDENFQKFLDTNEFQQKEMFQKSLDYAWQKEFRIILPPKATKDKQIIEIGALNDIAFGGDVEQLRQGFIFGEDEEHIKQTIEKNNGQDTSAI